MITTTDWYADGAVDTLIIRTALTFTVPRRSPADKFIGTGADLVGIQRRGPSDENALDADDPNKIVDFLPRHD